MFGIFTKDNKSEEKRPVEVIDYDFENVTDIASYFKETTGISFENQTSILKSKLSSFCKVRDIRSYQSCLTMIQSNRDLEQQLINYLTTNESFFYREFPQIEKLVNEIIGANRACDILCLPCATGEEPYSIVIALLEAGMNAKFNIHGVDISTEALERAKAGKYNQRNVSKMPEKLVQRYFQHCDGRFHLNAEVKARVKLSTLNLFSSEISKLGKFDYILSRNMLIYFDKETKLMAEEILKKLLKDPQQPIYFGHADLY